MLFPFLFHHCLIFYFLCVSLFLSRMCLVAQFICMWLGDSDQSLSWHCLRRSPVIMELGIFTCSHWSLILSWAPGLSMHLSIYLCSWEVWFEWYHTTHLCPCHSVSDNINDSPSLQGYTKPLEVWHHFSHVAVSTATSTQRISQLWLASMAFRRHVCCCVSGIIKCRPAVGWAVVNDHVLFEKPERRC